MNGGDIGGREWYGEGGVGLDSLGGKVDYGSREGDRSYGVVGVKVWVYSEGNVKS